MRELTLKRRRSRVRWVYLVYSRARGQTGARGRAARDWGTGGPATTVDGDGTAGMSALPAQERGDIEGRLEFEREIA